MTTYEPLKNQFGADVPVKIAAMICAVYPKFAHKKFTHDALNGYEALDLTPRARHISNALAVHLPADREKALHILIASLGPKLDTTNSFGMTSFIYLPHVFFVAEHGLAHFDVSMRAQYEITQRFTAEFSLRAFVEHDLHKTLTYLDAWIKDPSPHVRRLVSEGTRPRLPWAARLRVLQRDPSPMLPLLERLRDDPDLYVRRSVANHLNDIGKDHPALLLQIARDWLKNPPKQHVVRRSPRGSLTPARRFSRADPLPLAARYLALLRWHLLRLGEGRVCVLCVSIAYCLAQHLKLRAAHLSQALRESGPKVPNQVRRGGEVAAYGGG
jgi:3-methyladenine DNA glycosylase AlkC